MNGDTEAMKTGREARSVSRADDRLAQLYRAHSGEATRLAWLLTGDRQAAEDIAQEAFVRLGGKLLTLRDPQRATGYLLRTVANLAKDHYRRLKRDQKLMVVWTAEAFSGSFDIEVRDEVLSAMMTIAPRHRLILFLRYYLDMSEQQAAQTLGCSTAAIKSLTNRATVSIRKQLEGRGS